MNILGQGVQISLISGYSHKGMDCQPAVVSKNDCLACQLNA